MDDDKRGWRQFKQIKLDRKQFSRRVRSAEGATQRHAQRFIVKRIDNVRRASRQIVTWLLLIGLLIAGLGIQLAWNQANYTIMARKPGGVYVEGTLGQINSLNPLFATTSAEASLSRLMFSSLFNYDHQGQLHQDLARGVTVSEDNTVYTVTLKPNATWHDGKPVTAKDVVFTINLIKNPATRANASLRLTWLDTSVRALDDTHVEFRLPAVYASFPHALTFPIVPEHLLKDVAPTNVRESAYSLSPVGSGPFQFRRLQEADTLSRYRVAHMSAYEKYYDGAPKLSRFELNAYPDEASLLRAINLGEVSGATDVSVKALRDITNKQVKATPQALASGVYLLLNTRNPVLSDVKVRRALQSATDTGAIRKALGGGVLPLDGPMLSNLVSGDDVAHVPEIDLKKSATLLDEAGWKLSGSSRVKDGVTLEFTITTTKDKEFEEVLKLISDQWQKIGVRVKVDVIDTSNAASSFVQNVIQGRNFDILLYKLVIGADPDVFAYWHSSQTSATGRNLSNYSSPLADASLSSARARLEPDLRNAKYKQFVKQWIDDAPAIALYQPVIEYVTAPNVSSVSEGGHLVTGVDRYANVQYWTVENELVYKTP